MLHSEGFEVLVVLAEEVFEVEVWGRLLAALYDVVFEMASDFFIFVVLEIFVDFVFHDFDLAVLEAAPCVLLFVSSTFGFFAAATTEPIFSFPFE